MPRNCCEIKVGARFTNYVITRYLILTRTNRKLFVKFIREIHRDSKKISDYVWFSKFCEIGDTVSMHGLSEIESEHLHHRRVLPF
jgi:hypothetical protein